MDRKKFTGSGVKWKFPRGIISNNISKSCVSIHNQSKETRDFEEVFTKPMKKKGGEISMPGFMTLEDLCKSGKIAYLKLGDAVLIKIIDERENDDDD